MRVEQEQRAVLQIAFRPEGNLVNAYVERHGDTPFIQLAGSINVGMCNDDPELLRLWRAVMTTAVSRMAERLSGAPVVLENLRVVPQGGRA